MILRADKPLADKDTIQLVEFFIKSPTSDLPPSAVPAFMRVDPKTLPEKLRTPYEAKKEELLALQKIAEGKRKPLIRRYEMAEPKCDKPAAGTPELLRAWTMAGFMEATEEEVMIASSETKCSRCELETEFTLQRMSWDDPKKGKNKKTGIRYFFYNMDPVWMFIDMYRKNLKVTTGTAFFGIGGPPRCH